MKSLKLHIFLLFGIGLLYTSCGDDEEMFVNSTPQFVSIAEEIITAPGQDIVFTADLADEAGVREVNLRYDPWFLNKTIVKDTAPNDYALRYRFAVPADAVENSEHIVAVTVKSAGGQEVSRDVRVSLSADIVDPQLFINSPVDGFTATTGDGPEFTINVDVSDRELQTVEISSDIYNEIIPVSGSNQNITRDVDVPSAGLYTLTIKVTDATGNQTSQSVTVNIVDELSFPAMFITGANDEAELTAALFGAPFTTVNSTETDEMNFVFTARYYAEGADETVRFVPQKSSFAPFTFGADPNEAGVLLIGSDASTPGIPLAEGPGYYEITMNLKSLTYTVNKYTPADPTFDGFYIVGQGPKVGDSDVCTKNVDGSAACWTFESGKAFVQDPDNPYRWSQTVELADGGGGSHAFIFTATTVGWSPFWRLNANNINEVNAIVPNGGTELQYLEAHFGTYTITTDTHLNTIVAVPQ